MVWGGSWVVLRVGLPRCVDLPTGARYKREFPTNQSVCLVITVSAPEPTVLHRVSLPFVWRTRSATFL